MRKFHLTILVVFSLIVGCQSPANRQDVTHNNTENKKVVIYQVFTRLFGNTNTTNKPWGTKEENGVGKFNDFTDKALEEIKQLGVTHIWYTGVPHHALIGDYTAYGISNDDPDVVKGRAGSPYAVKDYYNVNPDLAVDPAKRLEEFEMLIKRTHNHGLKVIIDLVPNHVARNYHSITLPTGILDLGAGDDTSVEYKTDNNFYYIPGKPFLVPKPEQNYQPLGGEKNNLADGKYNENPARWTGNGSREPQPSFYDWYETIKINYGIKPDGTKDFPLLPNGYNEKDINDHYNFWQGKKVPSSWIKIKEIALYWLDKGVDGFRYDMAEMVPAEFWSYLNSAIKSKKRDAFLLAEVYNPSMYREYIQIGKMDYLYDKVELYDTLKNIIQGKGSTDHLPAIREGLADIEHHMLHFLENHDEQRIASPQFAGDAYKGLPMMVVSALQTTSPTMIYFGQEVGESGEGNPGFGSQSRTTIFDYWGVPAHQRWMNNGKFDGGMSTPKEKELRQFYKTLLNLSISNQAFSGEFADLHILNRKANTLYNDKLYSFARFKGDDKIIVIANLSPDKPFKSSLFVNHELIKTWQLSDGDYCMTDLLTEKSYSLKVTKSEGTIAMDLHPLQSLVLSLDK